MALNVHQDFSRVGVDVSNFERMQKNTTPKVNDVLSETGGEGGMIGLLEIVAPVLLNISQFILKYHYNLSGGETPSIINNNAPPPSSIHCNPSNITPSNITPSNIRPIVGSASNPRPCDMTAIVPYITQPSISAASNIIGNVRPPAPKVPVLRVAIVGGLSVGKSQAIIQLYEEEKKLEEQGLEKDGLVDKIIDECPKQHVQFAELPKNAVIKRQKYYHVDVLQVSDSAAYGIFKKELEQNISFQSAVFLIGDYENICKQAFLNPTIRLPAQVNY